MKTTRNPLLSQMALLPTLPFPGYRQGLVSSFKSDIRCLFLYGRLPWEKASNTSAHQHWPHFSCNLHYSVEHIEFITSLGIFICAWDWLSRGAELSSATSVSLIPHSPLNAHTHQDVQSCHLWASAEEYNFKGRAQMTTFIFYVNLRMESVACLCLKSTFIL